jgi:hypothetical protein
MYHKIFISKELKKKLNSKILWVTGSPRSGTTVIGNLIASLKNTEYFYEPGMFSAILPMLKKINTKLFIFLFESYFYLELIKNGLNKRNINLNSSDESFYLNFKNKKDLNLRKSFDVHNNNKQKIPNIIIKTPNFLKEIMYLKKNYNFNVIFVDRKPLEVINSLVQKKWWSKNLNRNLIIIEYKKRYYPYWLKKNKYKFWHSLNEYEKCAMQIIYEKKTLKKNKKIFVVRYTDLVNDPKKFIINIAKKYNMQLSKKTLSLLKKVKKNKKKDLSFIEKRIRVKILKQLYN